MSSTASEVVPALARAAQASPLASADAIAWLLLLPCAALTVLAVLLLGPPLGRVMLPRSDAIGFFSPAELKPEPTEQARYTILALAPLLLAGATIAGTRRGVRMAPWLARAAIAGAQVAMVVLMAFCWKGQYRPSPGIIYFTPATLTTAAALAALLVAIVHSRSLSARCMRWLRETRARRIGALAAAVAMTAIWLLHAINTDASIAWENSITLYHVQFALDEAFAVVNGLTPLVDYSAQYGSLWPYVSALALGAFGKTLLVFTITMCTLSGLSLLAIYGVLRRAARSSLAALLLYLPLLATSFFLVIGGTLVERHTFGSYFPMFPLRYAGPYLLAWLTARMLDRGVPRRTWPLFLAAGLVVLNNTEFGIAGFAATLAALLWTLPARDVRTLGRLAASAAAGVAGALALVAALTLARAGALPQLDRLVAFAHLYLVSGFGLIKMPRVLGFHLIVYFTYVAAIVVATVQALRGDANRVLTGMLAWSGVFGLGAASYYVGRSSDDTLPSTFSAWALAVALLTIVAVARTAGSRRRLPSLALLLTFYGMGIVACSLAQTPLPWTQLQRIRHPIETVGVSPPPWVAPKEAAERTFVSSIADGRHRFVVRHGAPIALFSTIGHRIADAYGVRDVVTTTGMDSIHTRQQFEESLDALRRAGGNTVLLPPSPAVVYALLARRGFELLDETRLRPWHRGMQEPQGPDGLSKWVDTRHLHPRALR